MPLRLLLVAFLGGSFLVRYSMRKITDLSNHRFGRLIVLRIHKWRWSGSICWECICDCGKERIVSGKNLKSGNTKSCGCLKEDIKNNYYSYFKQRIRKCAPNVRGSRDYRQWRLSIFERDDYICQYCSKKQKNPHTHHINNYADFPEQRLLLENGITLCKKHHKEYHLYDGSRHAGRNSFNKWMSNQGLTH